jgi:NADPH2:quinone reductase
MRAVVCHEIGPVANLSFEEVPLPEPGPGQVRVRIAAAGASYVDGLRAEGRYQFPLEPPYIPGGEAAGTIDAVGEGVTGFSVGDRVYAAVASGAFADALVTKARNLVRLPDEVGDVVGASFHQVYGTAWFALTNRTTVQAGETMVVTGAGGGVGLAAIDVGCMLGARVIAVASTEEKRRLALDMGAVAAIDTAGDVKTAIRELTDGAGADIVYDVTGGPVAEATLRATAYDGRYLVVGFTAGIPKLATNLVLLNNRAMIGVAWGSWQMRNQAANAEMMDQVLAAIARGDLHPIAPIERPLAEAPAVLAELLNRQAAGKIVLIP